MGKKNKASGTVKANGASNTSQLNKFEKVVADLLLYYQTNFGPEEASKVLTLLSEYESLSDALNTAKLSPSEIGRLNLYKSQLTKEQRKEVRKLAQRFVAQQQPEPAHVTEVKKAQKVASRETMQQVNALKESLIQTAKSLAEERFTGTEAAAAYRDKRAEMNKVLEQLQDASAKKSLEKSVGKIDKQVHETQIRQIEHELKVKEIIRTSYDKSTKVVQRMTLEDVAKVLLGVDTLALPESVDSSDRFALVTSPFNELSRDMKNHALTTLTSNLQSLGTAMQDGSIQAGLVNTFISSISAFQSGTKSHISISAKDNKGNLIAFHINVRDFIGKRRDVVETLLFEMVKQGVTNDEVYVVATTQSEIDAINNVQLGLQGNQDLKQLTDAAISNAANVGSSQAEDQSAGLSQDEVVEMMLSFIVLVQTASFASKSKVVEQKNLALSSPALVNTTVPNNSSLLDDDATHSAFIAAREEYRTLLQSVNGLVADIQKKYDKNNVDYEGLMQAATQFKTKLEDSGTEFFSNPNPTKAAYEKFKKECNDTFDEANEVFATHRGIWYNIPLLARKIIGVFAILAAAIPALIVQVASKHKFEGTFFATPKTDSLQGLEKIRGLMDTFQEDVNRTINPGG